MCRLKSGWKLLLEKKRLCVHVLPNEKGLIAPASNTTTTRSQCESNLVNRRTSVYLVVLLLCEIFPTPDSNHGENSP